MTLVPWSEGEILVRLTLATIAGGLIGWNRHRAGKPAGIGTYALVALGAAAALAIYIREGLGALPVSDAEPRQLLLFATAAG